MSNYAYNLRKDITKKLEEKLGESFSKIPQGDLNLHLTEALDRIRRERYVIYSSMVRIGTNIVLGRISDTSKK